MADEASPKPPPLPGVKSPHRSRLWLLAPVLLLGALFLFLRCFAVESFRMSSGSMQPTLMGRIKLTNGSMSPGDFLFAERISYLFRAPARGDIVIFSTTGIDSPQVPPGEHFVARIVGLPGDTVLFDPPGVRVNGQLLTNPPIFAKIFTRTNGYCGYTAQGEFAVSHPLELKDGEYFVTGDNSQNSLDSRYFGPIRRKQITARAVFIYYPFNRSGFLE